MAGDAMSQDGMARKLPTRSELPDEAKWRLEDIFPTDEAWEAEFQQLKEAVAQAGRYQGRVGESAQTLLAALKMQDELSNSLERVSQYAMHAQGRRQHQLSLPGDVPTGDRALCSGRQRPCVPRARDP